MFSIPLTYHKMIRCPYFDALPISKEDTWKLVMFNTCHIHMSFITLFLSTLPSSFHDLIPICHAKDKKIFSIEFCPIDHEIYLIRARIERIPPIGKNIRVSPKPSSLGDTPYYLASLNGIKISSSFSAAS